MLRWRTPRRRRERRALRGRRLHGCSRAWLDSLGAPSIGASQGTYRGPVANLWHRPGRLTSTAGAPQRWLSSSAMSEASTSEAPQGAARGLVVALDGPA